MPVVYFPASFLSFLHDGTNTYAYVFILHSLLQI